MTRPTRTAYSLTLEALSDDCRPAIVRLKRLLRYSLRALRLKCVALREVQPEQKARRRRDAINSRHRGARMRSWQLLSYEPREKFPHENGLNNFHGPPRAV